MPKSKRDIYSTESIQAFTKGNNKYKADGASPTLKTNKQDHTKIIEKGKRSPYFRSRTSDVME